LGLFAAGGTVIKGGAKLGILAARKIGSYKFAGVVYETVTEAIHAALGANPTLKFMLGRGIEKIIQAADTWHASGAGQAVAKVESKLVQLEGKVKDTVKGVLGRGTVPPFGSDAHKQLEAPKMIKHHVFNKFRGVSVQSEKYREFFKLHNIEVDKYTIEIPASMHRSKIHTADNNWTGKWKSWIDSNPNASTKEVYQFGGRLMDEYGVNHIPLVPYKKQK
jgi:hypothetical protein